MTAIEDTNRTSFKAQQQPILHEKAAEGLPLAEQSRKLKAVTSPVELSSEPLWARERQAEQLWQSLPASRGYGGDFGVHQRSSSKGSPEARTADNSVLEQSMQDSIAREAYIRRYQGSPINTVFAPGEYNIPE